MTREMALLDSRSFRNKLDQFIVVAGRKRPVPTDTELAEALKALLDAALGASPAPVPLTVPLTVPDIQPAFAGEAPPVPAKVKGIIEVMDEWINEWAPRVAATPLDAKGVRWINVPEDTPISELTGYLQDKETAPFVIDPSEMTMMNVQRGGWVLPCRMR